MCLLHAGPTVSAERWAVAPSALAWLATKEYRRIAVLSAFPTRSALLHKPASTSSVGTLVQALVVKTPNVGSTTTIRCALAHRVTPEIL